MKTFSKALIIAASLLVISSPARATIPVVDAASNTQLTAQLVQMIQQVASAEQQLSQLQSIFKVNQDSLTQVTGIMDTLGTTQQFKENNQAILQQVNQLSKSNLTQGLGDAAKMVGGAGGGGSTGGTGGSGGGGSLLEGFAGLTEPLAKVSSTMAKYGGQAFDIFSSGQDLYGAVSGMFDGSTGIVEGISAVGNILFGGGNPTADRLNKMSAEDMLKYGNNVPASVGSMWRQQTLASAKQAYADQIALAKRKEKVTEMAGKAETQADHLAVANAYAELSVEQQQQALNLQAQGTVSSAAAQEAEALMRQADQARRMGAIQASKY